MAGIRDADLPAGAVSADAIRHPAVNPVLLGNNWRTEVSGASCRRHLAHAHEGTSAALRRAAWRSSFLLHDHRLDDVELAARSAGVKGLTRRLRRFPGTSRRAVLVRPRR